MRFNPKARLDRSQVQVRRGGGGRRRLRRRGRPARSPWRCGGGIGGIIVHRHHRAASAAASAGSPAATAAARLGPALRRRAGVLQRARPSARPARTPTRTPTARALAVVNSIQAFWREALPEQTGKQYVEADTVMFTGSVDTGCGAAVLRHRAVLLPDPRRHAGLPRHHVLRGGPRGPARRARAATSPRPTCWPTSTATTSRTSSATSARSAPSRDRRATRSALELMADCLGGMWAKYATTAEDENGEVLSSSSTRPTSARRSTPPQAVGDDKIQQQSVRPGQPRVVDARLVGGPRVLVHERATRTAPSQRCDTFATDQLYPS